MPPRKPTSRGRGGAARNNEEGRPSTPNKPRSTRSATKALQEALSEDLPVQVKQVKKTPKTNKKTKTSADRDEEDEEAEEPTMQKMTVTSRILSESGAALAQPPRRAGTGVLLPPVAPRIVSTRVRRADPGDVPQVVDKGKGRDLTNLGSSDAEDEPEDNDEEEEDQKEEKKSSDEGPGDVHDDEEKEKTSSEEEKEKMLSDEVSNAGDDKSSDTGDDAMDLDSNITPRNLPASKRQASASPIAHRHVAQRSKADHANNTPLPAPVFAGFNDMPSSPIADDFNDLQGASRTIGGVARAKGHGVAPNMADFNTQQADLVPIRNEGRVLVYKHEDRTIAKPRAVRIPLAYTLGPVLKAMVKKMTALADSDISLWVNNDWEMKGPFAVAIEGDEPVEWDNNKEMELLMERSTQGSGFHPPPVEVMCTLVVQILTKNAGKWTGRDLSIDKLRSLYIRKTNYNTYSKMFDNAEQAVWGTRKLTKENLAAVTKELKDKEDKEKRAKEKARLAKEKKSKKASTSNFSLQALLMLLSFWLLLGLLPCVSAAPLEDPFPGILFADFAKVIKSSFGADITLATVLMLLFSVTNNTDLLNLHGQQQAVPTNTQVVTSWMAAFVCAIKDRLQLDSLVADDDSDTEMNTDSDSGSDSGSNSGSASGSSTNTSVSSDARTTYDTLFLPTDRHEDQSPKQQTTILGKKLDFFCRSLNLYSHNKRGTLRCKLLPISTANIRPVLIITPTVMQCSDATCPGRALTQYQRYHDVSKATLLRGSECFEKVPVLAGKCPACSSMFWADHEGFNDPSNDRRLAIHLPDTKYLKVGTQVWVDRLVSRAIVNANYSFHASTAAVTEFWNYSFVQPSGTTFKLTRRHTWKAFVLESIRLLAEPSGAELLFVDNMAVKDLVTAAYEYLGDGGIICSAEGHSCDECCHAFKDVADVIPNQPDNPAALAGHDENHAVPEYAGPAVEDAEAMDVDDVPASDASEPAEGAALSNPADVRMIVIDGIVMGPRHCAMPGCEVGLLNAQTGVFCKAHQDEMGVRCRMKDCVRVKVAGTQACVNHQEQWRVYPARYANSSLLGVQRMLRRAQEERQEWLPVGGGAELPEHDDIAEQEVEQVSGSKYNNYFSAPRFYCVETICAPCGVVLAWRKFAKSEGVAKILRFLEDVYPNPASRPSYIAIDKGAFNTQACEQLNAWLGGFQTVLNRMTVSNFDFTMHVLLFLHTQRVIARQQGREEEAGDESEDEEDENGVRYGLQEMQDDDD
ncbi:hypothetical protein PLEOSDRAFT_1084987 [Pleurotus ostreatus PC15]|uniref:CxC5 like cysteine cluster associated with KDZ domain-containing protein n=1 Tax=Pleurotus ostreatus (strain PC15) TaxID=1137138 RepID=A0A067NBM8_PLEO1|nr:hypothetical protein PLEOSDRAFT_1084987 [Pleurotus ostreatus PC15]